MVSEAARFEGNFHVLSRAGLGQLVHIRRCVQSRPADRLLRTAELVVRSPSGANPLHVHLPKPLHGWRTFVGEVGIIVIGVGIALAAEQAVAAAHWRQVVDAEGRALENELRDNYASMLVRVMLQPCIDRRLGEIAEVFRRHDSGQPLGLVAPIGRPTVFTGGKQTLEMATADQSLSHMRLERKQAIFNAYGAYDTFVPIAGEERSEWRVLQALDHPATLDSADWRDLRKAYDSVTDNNISMKTNLRSDMDGQWLTPFVHFPKPDRAELAQELKSLPYVQKLCRPAIVSQS